MLSITKLVQELKLSKSIQKKKIQLEHTKPIFNDMNLLSLHHLYIYHTFIDTLKLLKYRIPISIFELFKSSPRDVNIRLLVLRSTSCFKPPVYGMNWFLN